MKLTKLIIGIVAIMALYAFAKAEKETSTYGNQDPLEESMKRGATVYNENCAVCHMGTGAGVPNVFPPLAKSDWLTEDRREEAIRVVKYGQAGEIKVNGKTYNSSMANLGLYEDEVADVMNYILNNWGNSSDKIVTEEEVKAVKEE